MTFKDWYIYVFSKAISYLLKNYGNYLNYSIDNRKMSNKIFKTHSYQMFKFNARFFFILLPCEFKLSYFHECLKLSAL